MLSFFPYWIVVTHFLGIFFMLLLARSGGRFPWYARIFGGKQGARSLHFLGLTEDPMATGTPPSGSAQPPSRAERVDTTVPRLEEYRRDLYGGRGPGISEDEWLRNTSLRATVGEVPTAASREELHLRRRRPGPAHSSRPGRRNPR